MNAGAQARLEPVAPADSAAATQPALAALSISLPSAPSASPMPLSLPSAASLAPAFPRSGAIQPAVLLVAFQPRAEDPSAAQPTEQVSLLPEAPEPAGAGNDKDRDAKGKEASKGCKILPCPTPIIDWYKRFENGPQVKPMTPAEKGWLAARNVIDPFNVITILGISAISVAADSHSAYGPGFPGWGRYVGVSFTEDITGEFFGTFLICSIAHQDPHYHRMPQASYTKRILHALYQVAWTQGDNGKGMPNYSSLVGAGIDDEIANLYVPGRRTSATATAQRYGIALATAPIDNFITEFLPDVAKRIHIQVVVVQRIIDQVANDRSTNGGS